MESLTKKELTTEIESIKESVKAHEAQMKLHVYAIKIDKYLQGLMETELERFK